MKHFSFFMMALCFMVACSGGKVEEQDLIKTTDDSVVIATDTVSIEQNMDSMMTLQDKSEKLSNKIDSLYKSL